MDDEENNAPSSTRFKLLQSGPRPRELTGSVDLLAHHGLGAQYDAICTKPLPASVAESDYLRRVAGDIEIRRGEGMELGQLINRPDFGSQGLPIAPLDAEMLRSAFTFREAGTTTLPDSERGMPTISGNIPESKESEKKHKRHKDKDKEKRKDRDKEKDKKDREKDKRKERSSDPADKGEEKPRKHKKKKRKRGEEEKEGEDRKHKKKRSKHSSKSSKEQPPNGT